MVLLFPYSCKSYVSACTVFIPQKTLVDRFFLILDVPSYSRCTRFLLIYYFTLARGPPPLDFNSWSVDSQLKEAFPSVTHASLPITPGKQCLCVYLRGVWGLGATGARSGGQSGLKGWPGGTAKHGGGMRSRGGQG